MKNNMKKVVLAFAALALVVGMGAGCKGEETPYETATTVPTWPAYSNEEFGFSFQYPGMYNLKEKEIDDTTKYLDQEMRFILSLVDPTRGEKDDPIVFVYFAEGMNMDEFKAALNNEYAGGTEILREEKINQGGFMVTEMENTTSVSNNKIHYLHEHKNGLLIFSVFLYEVENFAEIFATMRGAE